MRSAGVLLLLAIGAAVGSGCGRDSADDPATTQRLEADAWFSQRIESLRREDGWLSLVGLHWIPEGDSTVGSDAGNDVVLAVDSGAPTLGTLTRDGTVVAFVPAPGVTVTVDGRKSPGAAIDTATTEPAPTFRHGRLGFFALRRGDRVGIRVFDTRSPVLTGFDSIERFSFAPEWVLEARLQAHDRQTTIAVPNILGDVTDEPSPGRVSFRFAGRVHHLDAMEGGDDGDLFLVFGDPTNGHSTYSGGRFVYTSPPRPDGTVLLDFNRAYNPPCVFTDYATCPLPPAGNRLPMPVEAGEKMWGHAH